MGLAFNTCTSEDLLVQQRSGWARVNARLRREDCEFVKHDRLFSKWKVLVGPSEWSEGSVGKDSTDRYHLQNLPAPNSGPGVYELGVTAPSWSPTTKNQRPRTSRSEDVIAVYVGQAADIRQRLQKYGEAGGHLEGSRSSTLYQGDDDSASCGSSSSSPRITQNGGGDAKPTESGGKKPDDGPRLFTEVFALGSSIAFRWAHTDSKVVAEQVESELLAVFDYAWNEGNTGKRRSRDILAKLFMEWPTNDSFCNHPMISGRRRLFSGANAVGIKVALRKPHDTPSNRSPRMGRVQMTLQPQVPVRVATIELRCGGVNDKGIPCNAARLRGRKFCLQHNGMRLSGLPAAGQQPSLAATQPTKVEPEQVGGGLSCIPKSFLRRQSSLPIKTRTDCDEVPKESEPAVERRRPPSLSFNSWMSKLEAERVRGSLDLGNNEGSYGEISFRKAIQQSETRQASRKSEAPRSRVRQVGSKYSLVSVDDSKRR